MELRLFIPDSPRRAWSALKYYLGVRQSPVKIYGIEDMRRKHRAALAAHSRLSAAEDKIRAQRTKISDLSKELSALKRACAARQPQ